MIRSLRLIPFCLWNGPPNKVSLSPQAELELIDRQVHGNGSGCGNVFRPSNLFLLLSAEFCLSFHRTARPTFLPHLCIHDGCGRHNCKSRVGSVLLAGHS